MALIGNAPSVPRELNGGVPVNIQDQTTKSLDLYFIKLQSQTTLAADITAEDTTITLTDTTGFVDGCRIGIFSGTGFFYFGSQLGAPTGSTIALDTPVDRDFDSALSAVICADSNLNVNGSSITQIYQIGPIGSGPEQPNIDITKISGYMESTSPMDDAKFGSLTALTKGIVLRKNNTIIENTWNAKSNSDLALLCSGNFHYSDKAPAGSYGARFVYTFAGQSNQGVTPRIEPGETLELLIQDDLTDLDKFELLAKGHVVTN
jgi:hypothetical protein